MIEDGNKPGNTTQRPNRRSIRLYGYDYRVAGAYFVTVCAHDKSCLFGATFDGTIRLNESGRIVDECLRDLPGHYTNVHLDEYRVMPNHAHAIIVLTDEPVVGSIPAPVVGAGLRPAPTPEPPRHGLPEIVRAWKSFSARRINEMRETPGKPVWERNYFERIVRDEREMANIQQYIRTNPDRWASDLENPERTADDDPEPWE